MLNLIAYYTITLQGNLLEISHPSNFNASRLKLARQISVMFLIVFIFLSFAYYTDSLESFLTMLLGILLSIISVYVAFIQKKYLVPFYIYSFGGVVVTSFALLTFHNTVHYVDFLWILAGVQLGFFGINKQTGFVLLFLALISFTYFLFFVVNTHHEALTERSSYQKFTLSIELLSAFLLNLYFTSLYLREFNFSFNSYSTSIHDLSIKQEEYEKQNNKRMALVHEVRVRVKENLQIMRSFLQEQQNSITEKEIKLLFQEAINRIEAMSSVHEKLTDNDAITNSSLQVYLKDLLYESLKLRKDNKAIKLSVFSSVDLLQMTTIVPIGLILNELSSNSVKHAFDSIEHPHISIGISEKNELLEVLYSDNGLWKEAQASTPSFGMSLVESLVQQLEGKMNVNKKGDGTQILLLFPKGLNTYQKKTT